MNESFINSSLTVNIFYIIILNLFNNDVIIAFYKIYH